MMTERKQPIPQAGGIFRNPDAVEVVTVHGNTAQELVVITVDRLRLRLVEHADTVQRKRAWMVPLGIFLPVLVAILTAEFQQFVLDPATWKAIFVVVDTVSFFWLVFELMRTREAASIDDLVEKIKESDKGA